AFLFNQGFSNNSGTLVKEISTTQSPAILAKISRHLGIIIDEVRFSDSLNIAAEMALFTLIEKTVDFQSMINRLELLEGKISSVSSLPQEASKKKTVLSHDSVISQENKAPLPKSKPAPEQNSSLKPHEGSPFVWKKFLGKILATRPVLYNILASLKVIFKDEKTWSLISDNKFELETVKKSKNELEKIIEDIAGIKISLLITLAAPQDAAPHLDEISNASSQVKESDAADNLNEDIGPMMPPKVKEKLADPSMAPVTTAGNWEELTSDDNFDSDAELKSLKKIFKGVKINKVSKKQ
ncbi:MAG: hypothetical protein U9Q34_06830, partial [Elusimicrobiota bacterium]|nr:hypothetical protein [Elusimicrobiota bacterium]